jgi:hypothetical protein
MADVADIAAMIRESSGPAEAGRAGQRSLAFETRQPP